MLGCIPFALAEQFQPGAVQHKVHRAVAAAHTRLPAGKGPAPARQRRVVRHGQVKPEQAQHAAGQTCCLSQGQAKDEPQAQHRLDRQVGVARLTARCAPARCTPAGQRCVVHPERQVAAAPQPCFVGLPVPDAVTSARDAVATGSVVFVRHRGDVAGPISSHHQERLAAPTPLVIRNEGIREAVSSSNQIGIPVFPASISREPYEKVRWQISRPIMKSGSRVI